MARVLTTLQPPRAEPEALPDTSGRRHGVAHEQEKRGQRTDAALLRLCCVARDGPRVLSMSSFDESVETRGQTRPLTVPVWRRSSVFLSPCEPTPAVAAGTSGRWPDRRARSGGNVAVQLTLDDTGGHHGRARPLGSERHHRLRPVRDAAAGRGGWRREGRGRFRACRIRAGHPTMCSPRPCPAWAAPRQDGDGAVNDERCNSNGKSEQALVAGSLQVLIATGSSVTSLRRALPCFSRRPASRVWRWPRRIASQRHRHFPVQVPGRARPGRRDHGRVPEHETHAGHATRGGPAWVRRG